MSLVSVDRLNFALGERRLLDEASFTIQDSERIALIGRNGEGKSTLIKLLANQVAADDGRVIWRSGAQVALVDQQPIALTGQTVYHAVAAGVGEIGEAVAAYHAATVALANGGERSSLTELDSLQRTLEAHGGWQLESRVNEIISRMQLPADASLETLSGGWLRRVALAQALVRQPDLLLLDEPTNHLDIDAIEWLEEYLRDYRASVLFVTHDRRFLQRLATRIFELDRGQLTSWPGDYSNYLRRLEERQNAESKFNVEFDKKLSKEEIWIRQGIQARRTRNEGRVRALKALREHRRARRERVGVSELVIDETSRSSRVVIDAQGISFRYPGQEIVNDFSIRIHRGEKIALLGANGVGKTTLIRLLLGELPPHRGTVRVAENLQIGYFDQHRAVLDESLSALDNVAGGRDRIALDGRDVHVITYLQRFLFSPDRARVKVAALSGGERNRLLLARLFTRPVNLLVLDEPTNDLDIETLEVLESLLVEFSGTLLLVSHDRAFIDNIVTSVLAFDHPQDSTVRHYVGGYNDWLVQSRARAQPAEKSAKRATPPEKKKRTAKSEPTNRKLSYNAQRELDELPARIEALEIRLSQLQERTAQTDFYTGAPDEIKRTLDELGEVEIEIAAAYERWESLEN